MHGCELGWSPNVAERGEPVPKQRRRAPLTGRSQLHVFADRFVPDLRLCLIRLVSPLCCDPQAPPRGYTLHAGVAIASITFQCNKRTL
jgi:hypothetical protein